MHPEEYPALLVVPRVGTETFHAAGISAGFDLIAFWRWLASDLAGNALRGVLAEYLVAKALAARGAVRTEWDACDLVTEAGIRVEVKCAAYLQSWSQPTLSRIEFDIASKRGWDAATNASVDNPCRSADVYVFALLAHRDKATLDPLDLTQWEFYVASRRALDAMFGAQKSIALSSLKRLVPHSVSHDQLHAAVALAAKL
jgi:hypothetical protein